MDIGGRRTFVYLAKGTAHAVEINTLCQDGHAQLEESGILGVLLWLWLKLHGLDFGHRETANTYLLTFLSATPLPALCLGASTVL